MHLFRKAKPLNNIQESEVVTTPIPEPQIIEKSNEPPKPESKQNTDSPTAASPHLINATDNLNAPQKQETDGQPSDTEANPIETEAKKVEKTNEMAKTKAVNKNTNGSKIKETGGKPKANTDHEKVTQKTKFKTVYKPAKTIVKLPQKAPLKDKLLTKSTNLAKKPSVSVVKETEKQAKEDKAEVNFAETSASAKSDKNESITLVPKKLKRPAATKNNTKPFQKSSMAINPKATNSRSNTKSETFRPKAQPKTSLLAIQSNKQRSSSETPAASVKRVKQQSHDRSSSVPGQSTFENPSNEIEVRMNEENILSLPRKSDIPDLLDEAEHDGSHSKYNVSEEAPYIDEKILRIESDSKLPVPIIKKRATPSKQNHNLQLDSIILESNSSFSSIESLVDRHDIESIISKYDKEKRERKRLENGNTELHLQISQLQKRLLTYRADIIPKSNAMVPTSLEANIHLRNQYKKILENERRKYVELEMENIKLVKILSEFNLLKCNFLSYQSQNPKVCQFE